MNYGNMFSVIFFSHRSYLLFSVELWTCSNISACRDTNWETSRILSKLLYVSPGSLLLILYIATTLLEWFINGSKTEWMLHTMIITMKVIYTLPTDQIALEAYKDTLTPLAIQNKNGTNCFWIWKRIRMTCCPVPGKRNYEQLSNNSKFIKIYIFPLFQNWKHVHEYSKSSFLVNRKFNFKKKSSEHLGGSAG